jgi:hypothetical protein
MSSMNASEGSAGRFHNMQRKAVRITPDAVVRYGYLDEDKRFPLVSISQGGRQPTASSLKHDCCNTERSSSGTST